MSSEVAAPEILAIAFVVESSLAIATEWHRIIVDYVSQMLKRLSETNPGCRLYMGFVTYATAYTRPTPLLCKRFFNEYQYVTKDMKEDPAKLGIGHTNSRGSEGMAALEGLVAAIELFDILRNASQPGRSNICHIFHVAASAPDASEHPQWNDSPSLDSVTWDDLPLELTKRNINISSINLRPNLPRFSELHSAVAPGAPKDPWFTLRPPHSVLLAGFTMSGQTKTMKRPGELHNVERTPESKRLRLTSQSSVDASPKAPQANPPTNPPKPSPTAPSQPQPQPPAAQPQIVTQHQSVLTTLRTLEEQLRSLQLSIQTARTMGKPAQADGLAQQWTAKNILYQRFKQAFAVIVQKQQLNASKAQAQVAGQNQEVNQTQAAGPSAPTNRPLSPDTTLPTFGPEGARQGTDPQVVAQHLHKRTQSGSVAFPTTQASGSQAPPLPRMPMAASNAAVATQIEQQQRSRPPQNLAALSHPNQNMEMRPGVQGQPQPAPSGELSKPQPKAVWSGALAWGGQGAGKKEIRTYVVASTQNTAECRAETWPNVMMLVPSREPAVSTTDLQAWMKRHRPVLCTFQVQHHGVPDPKTNEAYYRSLAQLLVVKGMYVVAAWTLPSGVQENNVLIFPISGAGLMGAFFPVNGIPEMPKPLLPQNNTLINSTTNIHARLQHLSPSERELVIGEAQRQRELQQASQAAGGNKTNAINLAQIQQQLQQPDLGGSSALSGNVHPPGNYGAKPTNMAMGHLSGMMPGGLSRPVGGGMHGGVGTNVSYEMLQSFMQRNPEGGTGMG